MGKNQEPKITCGIDAHYTSRLTEGQTANALKTVKLGYGDVTIRDIESFEESMKDGKKVGAHIEYFLSDSNGTPFSVIGYYEKSSGGIHGQTMDTIDDMLAVLGHPTGKGNGHFLTDVKKVKDENGEVCFENINRGKKFNCQLVLDQNNQTGTLYYKLWNIKPCRSSIAMGTSASLTSAKPEVKRLR